MLRDELLLPLEFNAADQLRSCGVGEFDPLGLLALLEVVLGVLCTAPDVRPVVNRGELIHEKVLSLRY